MSYKERISKGFWIWGQFDTRSATIIRNNKKKINNILDGPEFDAHITLSGPIMDLDNTLKSKTFKISTLFSPFTLHSEGIGLKDEFFQSLFIKIKKTQELLDLKMRIDDELMLNSKNYFPHISLYYGDSTNKLKEDSIRNIAKLDDITLDKISLVAVDEAISSWKIIESFELSH